MSIDFTIRQLTHEHEYRKAHQFISKYVFGYSPANAAKEERDVRRRVTYLLPPGLEGGLASVTVFVAELSDGEIIGAAVSHPPYGEADDIVTEHGRASADFVRGVLSHRRTLSGLAIAPGWRRNGTGRLLVQEHESHARAEGASWLTGFMDERNGEPGFYERLEFTVTARNRPLPPLAPYPVTEIHPPHLNGQWFYRQL